MPKIINYKSKSKIVETDKGKYLYKLRKKENTTTFNYLRLKGFNNFLEPLTITPQYEVYPYIEELNIPDSDKAIELINNLIILHVKTTTYQEIDLEKTKALYNDIKEKITYLRNYYLDLQDFLETREFMSPAEYLLMINISTFYKALRFSEGEVDNWYKEKSSLTRERTVMLHKNLSLEHFLIGEKPYFINWDYATRDLVIYDFLSFYHNEFKNVEMTSLFEQYQAKYTYTNEEQMLFNALIAIPPKLTFKNSTIVNLINVRNAVDYVSKTNNFLLKYYKKYQQPNK